MAGLHFSTGEERGFSMGVDEDIRADGRSRGHFMHEAMIFSNCESLIPQCAFERL